MNCTSQEHWVQEGLLAQEHEKTHGVRPDPVLSQNKQAFLERRAPAKPALMAYLWFQNSQSILSKDSIQLKLIFLNLNLNQLFSRCGWNVLSKPLTWMENAKHHGLPSLHCLRLGLIDYIKTFLRKSTTLLPYSVAFLSHPEVKQDSTSISYNTWAY